MSTDPVDRGLSQDEVWSPAVAGQPRHTDRGMKIVFRDRQRALGPRDVGEMVVYQVAQARQHWPKADADAAADADVAGAVHRVADADRAGEGAHRRVGRLHVAERGFDGAVAVRQRGDADVAFEAAASAVGSDDGFAFE